MYKYSTIKVIVRVFFKLAALDQSALKWKAVIDRYRIGKFLFEIIVCAIAPIPSNSEIKWSFIEISNKTEQMADNWIDVPIDVPLAALVILRFYLLGRFAVLHSRLWQGTNLLKFFVFWEKNSLDDKWLKYCTIIVKLLHY